MYGRRRVGKTFLVNHFFDKSLSFDANIDNLFFKKRAELWDEYDHLYSTLFSSSENYTKVVEALSEKRQGLTRSEIALKTKLADNDKLTKILHNLVDSGFVRAYPYFGKRKQNTFYQSEYQITKDYDEKVRKKMSVFRTVTKTKKALQLVMITTYGLTSGMYSERVQAQVVLDDLFENVKFLG